MKEVKKLKVKTFNANVEILDLSSMSKIMGGGSSDKVKGGGSKDNPYTPTDAQMDASKS